MPSIALQVNSVSLDMLLAFTLLFYTFLECKGATQSFDYIVHFFRIIHKKSLAQTQKYIEIKLHKIQEGTVQRLLLDLTKLK